MATRLRLPKSWSTCSARREQSRAALAATARPADVPCAPGEGGPPLPPGSDQRDGPEERGAAPQHDPGVGAGGISAHRKGPAPPPATPPSHSPRGWSWGSGQERGGMSGLSGAVSPVSTLHVGGPRPAGTAVARVSRWGQWGWTGGSQTSVVAPGRAPPAGTALSPLLFSVIQDTSLTTAVEEAADGP